MDHYSLSVGVIVIKDEKVLLVKHNYGSANGKYLNPGGYLKDDELPEEAAVREVYEETGIEIAPIGMLALRCSSRTWYMVLQANYVGGEPRVNAAENSDVLFMDIKEALEHPFVTDSAKQFIQLALKKQLIPPFDARKNRKLYAVDRMEQRS